MGSDPSYPLAIARQQRAGRANRFEWGSFEMRQIEVQIQLFAEEVMPVWVREQGRIVEFKDADVDLAPLVFM
jgi:hypothetical protein